MKHRTVVLAVCLVGTLTAMFGLAAEQGTKGARGQLRFLPAGNLQVGVPGELLSEPIAVQATPGAAVQFLSPDLGVIDESGQASAIVVADEQGIASVHLRLGANLGRYTVVATLAHEDGPQIVYDFRAIEPEAMQARAARIAAASGRDLDGNDASSVGGGQ